MHKKSLLLLELLGSHNVYSCTLSLGEYPLCSSVTVESAVYSKLSLSSERIQHR